MGTAFSLEEEDLGAQSHDLPSIITNNRRSRGFLHWVSSGIQASTLSPEAP